MDRDGTLIQYRNYLHEARHVSFYKGAIDAVKAFQNAGYKLVLVTNQSGVGRGYFKRQDLETVHQFIIEKLRENGLSMDGIYVCAHHPKERCACRKPNVALFWRAQKDLSIDMKRSFFIGDRLSDVVPAKRLGGEAILVLTGLGCRKRLAAQRAGIRTAQNLLQASRQILKSQS